MKKKQFRLSSENAETRLLSNDAFFYLKDEDDPIDEENLEEAFEIIAMFPNGYAIRDDWKYTGNDTIEATFIPYVEDTHIMWDGEHRVKLNNGKFDTWAFAFKIISHSKCYARWYDDSSGRCIFEGECAIEYYTDTKPLAITPTGSRIPLYGSNVKYFNNLAHTHTRK